MNDLHPDDEALSAHLDEPSPAGSGGHEQSPAGSGGHEQSPAGSGGHEQSPAGSGGHEQSPQPDRQLRDHLDGCEACAARLAALRRVRVAVGTPVPPPPAWQRDAAIARALEAVGHGAGSRRTLGRWGGGIAAAMLLVLGAAFGLSQLSNHGGPNTTSARATKAAEGTAREPGATPPTSGAVSELGDLGALSDAAALRAVVEPTLGQRNDRAAGAANAAPRTAQLETRAATTVPAPRCVDAARALDPANLHPAASGIATWRGTPADVLVYAVAGRPGAARVYVLARAGCRVLEFQSYAP